MLHIKMGNLQVKSILGILIDVLEPFPSFEITHHLSKVISLLCSECFHLYLRKPTPEKSPLAYLSGGTVKINTLYSSSRRITIKQFICCEIEMSIKISNYKFAFIKNQKHLETISSQLPGL